MSKISHPRRFIFAIIPIHCDQFRSKLIEKMSDFRLAVIFSDNLNPLPIFLILIFFRKRPFSTGNIPKTWIFLLSKKFNLFKSVLTQESDSISFFILQIFEILTKIKFWNPKGFFWKAEIAIWDHLRSPGLEDSTKVKLNSP